ncbi:MAG: hypothetical protein AAFU79_08480 [Myxococcota bacterium]
MALFAVSILLTVGGFVLRAQRSDGEARAQGARAASKVDRGGPGARTTMKDAADLIEARRDDDSSVPAGIVERPIPGPGQDESTPSETSGEWAAWSPLLIKGGFSFAVAFALGFALRSFLRLALLVVGTIGLAIFALAYWGGVDLSPAMTKGAELWDGFAGQVQAEASSFQAFMTGNLPSAASASLGLFSGFKKG